MRWRSLDEVTLPEDPALVGQGFYAQAWVVDPGANQAGLTVSNAIDATMGW